MNDLYIVVPTSDAFDYWAEHLCPFKGEYPYEHEDEMMDWFDHWITHECGELLDGTDIQYMFAYTFRAQSNLMRLGLPYRVIDRHGDDWLKHEPERN